jgi:hypothetical protein
MRECAVKGATMAKLPLFTDVRNLSRVKMSCLEIPI